MGAVLWYSNDRNTVCRSTQTPTDMSKHSLEYLIPRIWSEYNDARTGIHFVRKQFPVWPAFAMTVNKAQGQTLNKVGLIFESPSFSHGQTYVALSRVRSKEDILVYSEAKPLEDKNGVLHQTMANIVFKSIL